MNATATLHKPRGHAQTQPQPQTKDLSDDPVLVALDMSNGMGYVGKVSKDYVHRILDKDGIVTINNFLRYVSIDVLRETEHRYTEGKTYAEIIREHYVHTEVNPDGRKKLEKKTRLNLEHCIESHFLK